MLYKALKAAPYLYKHKQSSSFYFRRSVPASIRPLIMKSEIKLSLKTSNKQHAILMHNHLANIVELIFSGDLSLIKKLQIDSLTKNSDGTITVEGLKTDPANPEQDIAFLEALGLAEKGMDTFAAKKAKEKHSMLFSELIVKYLGHAKLPLKTQKQDEAIFQTFLELFDDPDLSDIDHPLVTNFVEIIEKYPANAKKYYPNLTAKQIAKLNHGNKKLMSTHSVNKYVGRLGLAFKYAVNHGLMKENFAEGKRIKNVSKRRQHRLPFTKEELGIIFTKADELKDKKSDLYWLIYIGAYTGMRLSEICQLQPHDVAVTNGIIHFDINEEHHLKSCKTDGSERYVPAHPELLKRGLLEFAQGRKNQEFLFGWKHHEKNGWAHYSSKAANYFIKTTCKMSDKTFHCFRHTVADTLMKNMSATITKEIISGLLGHSQESETFGRYGKGFALQLLNDAVKAIQYMETDEQEEPEAEVEDKNPPKSNKKIRHRGSSM